jgi:hypothetical protein
MGLFFGTITLTLAGMGAAYGELSKLTLIGLPYAFKLFFGPILDTVIAIRLAK